MKKCPTCSTGKLMPSGAHEYCNTCNFAQFAMTDDYISVCANVVAILISNTRFDSQKACGDFIGQQIDRHLPRMAAWLRNMTSGQQEFMEKFCSIAISQSINLQIDETTHNEQEESSLVCQCGNEDFNMITQAHLMCKSCDAEYYYDEDAGLYVPYFTCICGNLTFESVDDSGLCECRACHTAFIHDDVNKIFRMVTV